MHHWTGITWHGWHRALVVFVVGVGFATAKSSAACTNSMILPRDLWI